MMNRRLWIPGVALSFVMIFGAPVATAGPYADSLSRCLVSGTTPAEKTTLVRWMFAMMALHPEVESGAKVTAEQRAALSRETALLFQRLLTQACAGETREAVKYEGASTIESSFSLLGQVAARELFSHPRVAEGLSEFASHIHSEAFKGILEPAEEQQD